MSEEEKDQGIPVAPVEGKMFLYEQPELLTVDDHGALGVTPPPRPFDFAAKVRAIPLVVSEIASAQRNFPIIFSDMENPVPLAVVGLSENSNLFVDADGRWDQDAYIPAYLRCHPFALAVTGDEKFAVVVDRAAPSVGENAEFPFFDGQEMAPNTKAMVDFCGKYEGERRKTMEYVERLKALDLLGPRRATHKVPGSDEEQTIASYIAVVPEKLGDLPADTVKELNDVGMLAVTYAHLFSLENWLRLLERHQRVMAATSH
ncbi:MAG: SapC family protein [Pseudomonadota bacterium]